MRPYLLTYDLEKTYPDPRSIVNAKLYAAGWRSRARKDGLSWAYPNTTLGAGFDTDEEAIAAYRSAIENAEREAAAEGKGKVMVEKVYITRRTEVLFESDDKKPPKTEP